ncbi:MAG: LysM peptidoglycan-binding domain-containing protein, partial [Candidatus Promineifilaceae bacterium]|nr:LysM peptidoglycan-binding domain-containing protein [Candidatus Promineifilaceae bacterium]
KITGSGSNRSIEVNSSGVSVDCLFNPHEYSVSQSHSYNTKFKKGSNVPDQQFDKPGAKKLSLTLWFDTYLTKEDVTQTTRKLWQLMEVKVQPGKKSPPPVAFEWGGFQFFAVITSMTQTFKLFLPDGTPVRAEVKVDMEQMLDADEYTQGAQNPTSGGGPPDRVWEVAGADRLDTIANAVYSDATKWRRIAEYNNLANPLALRPGQRLTIPPEE